MESDASRVIVTKGLAAHTTQVHHRDFPEIRFRGRSSQEAASHLVHELTRALDSALTKWRREAIENAIADVSAFVATND
jgi:hypothetical protein